MAQWKETLEPYVKVKESVKTVALNPKVGEDLIVGAVIISDAGPATPTLISSQSEFLKTFSSTGEITEDYIYSLDNLFTSDPGSDVASTMWLNAYKLAGSNTLLVSRASKASDMYYSKPLDVNDNTSDYIVKDGEILKRVPSFKFVIDYDEDSANHNTDGWSINISDVGIIGNRVSDEGAQYDYYVSDLFELVDQLNETPKFFSPNYKFYSDIKCEVETELASEAKAVLFEEVYLGCNVLELEDSRCPDGLAYIVCATKAWDWDVTEGIGQDQNVVKLNDPAYSGFVPSKYYAMNLFNSSTNLKVRIRRFNHDAVASRVLSGSTLNAKSDSPWTVLTNVLDTFTKKGSQDPAASILERDFYEVAVFDPSINSEPLFFNVGKIPGRGDITTAELNNNLGMIQLQLPADLIDLGLNYYGYVTDDARWVELPAPEPGESYTPKKSVSDFNALLQETGMALGDIYQAGQAFYSYEVSGNTQVYVDLNVDPSKSSLLDVSDGDLEKAWDKIVLQEVYTVECICDSGNTRTNYQSYLANLAENHNYFYPVSTLNSTNYLTINNHWNKLTNNSYKLYGLAPWSLDESVGFQFPLSPAVVYLNTVSSNKKQNREFAACFGLNTGIAQISTPVATFDKKTRQLLLTKKINTISYNASQGVYAINDNVTKLVSNEMNVMSEECNSRLMIRISKAQPALLEQFKARQITSRLYSDIYNVEDYWFKTTILPMVATINDYRITVDETNNTDEDVRANRVNVKIEVRYNSSAKYFEVSNIAYAIGTPFEGEGE